MSNFCDQIFRSYAPLLWLGGSEKLPPIVTDLQIDVCNGRPDILMCSVDLC